MTQEDSGFGRMTTHVRVVAYDATEMPSPEIRALARVDVEVHEHAVGYCPPVSRRFATLADTTSAKFVTCSPATLCQTIWNPRAPAALVGWGSATWDVFVPAFTRFIPRIDILKIARLAWPDDHVADPVALATRAGFRRPPAVVGQSVARNVADRAQAIADLFGAVVTLVDDSMVERAAKLDSNDVLPAPDSALGDLRGDARLVALIRLSAEPMPPLGPLPGPWDDDRVWFGIAGEDLAWIAGPQNSDSDDYAREAARVELDRRAAREAALLRPRSLLRQPAQD